ncbi:hypothetical protein E2C01_101758 [Portunus trituberculatus]|uniref:Uncharacterized protein n=1 Tax=Portunus trituberculatus TaxID=210409 RepID=A0A5B7KBG4_PORTR|nr:hypothetical protein [Portunus trituberculatus]
MPHQCGLPPSPALNSNNWKMFKRGPAESYIALPTLTMYDHALSTLDLPTLATRHQAALVKMGRGLLTTSIKKRAPANPCHTTHKRGHATQDPKNCPLSS